MGSAPMTPDQDPPAFMPEATVDQASAGALAQLGIPTMRPDEDPLLFSPERVVTISVVALMLIAAALGYHFRPRQTLAADGLGAHWDAAVEQNRAAHKPALV